MKSILGPDKIFPMLKYTFVDLWLNLATAPFIHQLDHSTPDLFLNIRIQKWFNFLKMFSSFTLSYIFRNLEHSLYGWQLFISLKLLLLFHLCIILRCLFVYRFVNIFRLEFLGLSSLIAVCLFLYEFLLVWFWTSSGALLPWLFSLFLLLLFFHEDL